jgi:hypothetical protein
MKKLIVLALLMLTLASNAQKLKISDWPFKTSTAITDRIFGYSIIGLDTAYWQMYSEKAFPWIFNASVVYPRLSTYQTVFGSTPSGKFGTYPIVVYGNQYISGTLDIGTLRFGTNSSAPRIGISSNDLYFYDAENGIKYLSDLIGGSSLTLSNGITTTGKLGAPLTENTTIDIDDNYFLLGKGTTNYISLDNLGGATLKGTTLALWSTGSDLSLESSKFKLYSDPAGTYFYDKTSSLPVGLQARYDYYANIKSQNTLNAYMTYIGTQKLVEDMINADTLNINSSMSDDSSFNYLEADTLHSKHIHLKNNGYITSEVQTGAFIAMSAAGITQQFNASTATWNGQYYIFGSDTASTRAYARSVAVSGGNPVLENVTASDTTRWAQGGTGLGTLVTGSSDTADNIYVLAYTKKDRSTYDTLRMVQAAETKLHMAEIDITSANILNGDSLNIVAAPGSMKIIVPVRFLIYYDYSTSSYSSSDGSNSALIKSPNHTNAIFDDTFEYLDDGYFYGVFDTNSPFSSAYSNKSFWIDFYTHTGTGTGTAKLKFWYYVADFN